jgi:hypothetical protein
MQHQTDQKKEGVGGLPVTEGSRVNMQYIRRVTSCMQVHLRVYCVYGFLRISNTAFNLKWYDVICLHVEITVKGLLL